MEQKRTVPAEPSKSAEGYGKAPGKPLQAAGGLVLGPRGSENDVPAPPVAPTVPATPVTPVTAEGFASLRDLILERDTHGLKYAEMQRLQRDLQKLTKAAQSLLVKGALQEKQVQFLRKINDEGSARRAEKSLVLRSEGDEL